MLKTRYATARVNSLRSSSVTPLVLTAILALTFGLAGHHAQRDRSVSTASVAQGGALQTVRSALQSVPAVSHTGAAIAQAIAPTPVHTTREAELDEGQSFADMLEDQGLDDNVAQSAINALAHVYDVRRLRAGQDFTLSFDRTDSREVLTNVVFQPEDTKEISLSRADDGSFAGHVTNIPVTRHRIAASGAISSTLYEAGERAGVTHALMASFIRIYSHNIDFQRDVHPGDRFEILYDQSITAKGKAVGDSTIVYAMLNVDGHPHALYRVTFNDGTTDYFDEHGQSVRRALLRTPVAAARITSGFGMRVHPLLGYSKMHKGVDFGAPTGAPIFAAGSGTIEEIGFKNGYGRYIRIRHNGSMETAYAHMSRFASSMFRGSHVNQGEVIGYVGMSGRATGPHLHFEVLINNQQVNPMSVQAMPTGRSLNGKMLTVFRDGQIKVREEFDSLLASRNGVTPISATGAAYKPATQAVH